MRHSNRSWIAAACFALCTAHAWADDPCQPQRLVTPPGTEAVHYGTSVATNGRFWFVGDSQAAVPGCSGGPLSCAGGAVHVYEMVDGRLEFFQTLVPDGIASFDQFGTWIDVDGDRAVVGSYNTAWSTTAGRGGGFVFEFNGSEWIETASLAPPSDFEGTGAGTVVQVAGDTITLSPSDQLPRVVWVYENGPSGWAFTQTVESPVPLPASAGFGRIAVLDDDWLIVMAYWDATRVRDGGSVFAFRRGADGTYEFAQQLLPPEPFVDTREFGVYVVLDGETLAIGARRVEREFEWQGAVFIYEFDGDEWALRQELTHEDPSEGDQFGWRLALHRDTLLARTDRGVRLPGDVIQDGEVRRFERGADGTWRETGSLVSNTPYVAGLYGNAIATDGIHALVGASQERELPPSRAWPGATYLFDLACGACEPDLDADGELSIFDFLTFLNAFDAGDPIADFDADGAFTLFDFLAFQAAFDAGCF